MSLKAKWLPSVRHHCYLPLQTLNQDVKGALDLLRELGKKKLVRTDSLSLLRDLGDWRIFPLLVREKMSGQKGVTTDPAQEEKSAGVNKKPERCSGESLYLGHGRPKTLMWREYSRRNKASLFFEHLLFISHCVIKIVLNLTSFILLLLLYQLINPTLRLLFYGERNWIEHWLIWPRQINNSHWPQLNCDRRFPVTPNAKSSDTKREGLGNKTISSLQTWNKCGSSSTRHGVRGQDASGRGWSTQQKGRDWRTRFHTDCTHHSPWTDMLRHPAYIKCLLIKVTVAGKSQPKGLLRF